MPLNEQLAQFALERALTPHGEVQFRSARTPGRDVPVTHVLLHGIGSASASWLAHLVQWRPDYIKLAGNYLNNLREQESGRFCISAVVRTADVLGIAVYASMVEDPQLLPILAECGVRGAQGYALRAPELLSAG